MNNTLGKKKENTRFSRFDENDKSIMRNIYVPHFETICQVCGKRIHSKMICQFCGHDRTTDYEAYMSLGLIEKNYITTYKKREIWETNLVQEQVKNEIAPLEKMVKEFQNEKNVIEIELSNKKKEIAKLKKDNRKLNTELEIKNEELQQRNRNFRGKRKN